ncbi:MAG: lipid A deacylase LpxR family protein [Verrucomicrobia bacterium]|nr:lipid A deacylase LpxR family protein [Verrucomicrobiota bacterium]
MKFFLPLRAALALAACIPTSHGADHDLRGPAFNLVAENDMVVRTDRHYTHGTKLTLLGSEVAVARESAGFHFPAWLAEHTPDLGAQMHAARLGASLGQSIYTPTDISTTALQLNDRPYAGVLYASLLLQKRGASTGGTPLLDSWRLDLGVIGPESQAEDAQNTVHRVRNLGIANGWANQLRTEPALALRFQRTWHWPQSVSEGWGWDFLPGAGVSLGNLGTYAVLGGQLRVGWRLPGDFGVQTIDAIPAPSMGRTSAEAARRGVFAFAGAEGHAVAYSAFLDGNLWRASHHVVKFPLVADAKFGLVYSGKRFDVSITQVIRSKEFVGQREIDAYGALALSVKWDPPASRRQLVLPKN